MKKPSLRGVAVCAALTVLLGVGVADAAKTKPIHDGVYAPLASGNSGAEVNLYVAGNGKALGPGSAGTPYAQAVECPLTSAMIADGYSQASSGIAIGVPYDVAIPIHNGKFSYTGAAYVDPSFDATPGDTPNPGTITISGHFKTTGKIVSRKTTAVTGTVSLSLCGTSIPSSFALAWIRGLQHG
jgi:hypothetical protein